MSDSSAGAAIEDRAICTAAAWAERVLGQRCFLGLGGELGGGRGFGGLFGERLLGDGVGVLEFGAEPGDEAAAFFFDPFTVANRCRPQSSRSRFA